MLNRNNLFLLLNFVVVFSSLSLFSQHLDIEKKEINIIPIKEVQNPVVTCVYQDSFGFNWFGSLNGIYRWDGENAKHYYHISGDTNSIPFDQIISFLFEDKSNNLWFGTLGQGAIKYNRYTDNFSLHSLNKNHPELIDARWITRAIQDSDGNIWGIGITNRLFKCSNEDQDYEVLNVLVPDTSHLKNPINNILSIQLDFSSSFLWVGTAGGLLKYSFSGKRFIQVSVKDINQKEFKVVSVTGMLQNNDSILWLSTFDALYKYNISMNEIKQVMQLTAYSDSNPAEQIEEIIESPFDDKKDIWVFTNKNIYRFNKYTNSITNYIIKNAIDDYESSAFVSAKKGRFIDENGFLWLATDNIGAAIINLNPNPFEQYFILDKKGLSTNNGATVFYSDNHNNLWVGTGFKGLYQFNQKMELINHYEYEIHNPNSLSNNYIYSICETNKGSIWIGTEQGLNRLNPNLKSFEHYITEPIPYEGNLPHVRIADIYQDSTGRLWIGTTQGVYYTDHCDENKVNFLQFDAIPYHFNLTQQIFKDKRGDIWFVTPVYHGIFRLTKEPGNKRGIINYNSNSDQGKKFITDGALAVFEDNKGIFWLGTKQGLYKWDRTENSFEYYHKENGLGANMIYWLEGDNNGNLWLSTEAGLIRFNPELTDERMSKNFTYKDGLPFEEIYPYRFYKSSDGNLYIGGRRGSGNGFYRFHPDSIRENKYIPPIVITDFRVHDENYSLDSSITVIRNIRLKYHEDFFSFEFAALDYIDPDKNQYAYYLDGFEDNWNYVGNRNFANYTGIPPGEYVFRVKGSNNDGYWNERGASVALLILPPPWKTWWAYLVYALFIIAIIFSIFYYYFRRQQLLHKLQLEHVEAEKLKELDGLRSRFFANISHEFRTPLTLILGPLEKVLSKLSDESDKKEINIARKNAKRLQKLINQILTISKIESGKMKLRVSEINIVKLISGYIQAFESLARQKQIQLYANSKKKEIKVFIDVEKFEQVLYNLISNALKFTDEGGRVDVDINIISLSTIKKSSEKDYSEESNSAEIVHQGNAGNKQFAEIKISDTGCGISPEHIDHIFERFYQVEKAESSYYQGTGIGLSLTKELIVLHHGLINVNSSPGKGTTFSIYLPLGKGHIKPDEIVEQMPEKSIDHRLLVHTEIETTADKAIKSDNIEISDKSAPVILVVEDNMEMRKYIRGFFEHHFQIIEATDGKNGYEKSLKYVPDLIISDIMMPIMDGNEFCSKIKTDERTCHIPVILLTARASRENRIEGLETGADDFIIKPFDGEELQVRVRNLIEQRSRIRDIIARRIQKSTVLSEIVKEETDITSLDEQFMQKIFNTVKSAYSDPEFNVEKFCKVIGMSRIQLHRKIKALTGQTTGEFIRIFRLNRAAEMLRMKSATIAEIAYDTGFNSPSYFSECFRKHFGKLPSEFLNDN